MNNKTYQRNELQKAKETIKLLKDEVNRLKKQIKMLEQIKYTDGRIKDNLTVDKKCGKNNYDIVEFKREFYKRFKESLERDKNENEKE